MKCVDPDILLPHQSADSDVERSSCPPQQTGAILNPPLVCD